jgi:hypothetical protein
MPGVQRDSQPDHDQRCANFVPGFGADRDTRPGDR